MKPEVYISRQQSYGCILCGRCCRRFYVLLRREEVERLGKLDWGDEKDVPTDFSEEIHGHPYFKRKSDGGCVFLDDDGACRMHRRFGFDKKALTCRGYPFNIVSTFPGEVSVLARMDCPAVVRDAGRPIREQRNDILQLVSELHFGKGFTEEQLHGMSRESVALLCAQCQRILDDERLSMCDCARLLMSFALRAERLGGIFLNDTMMPTIYPSIVEGLRASLADLPKYGIGPIRRSTFRQLLTCYCRRDEELLDRGLGQRVRHAFQIARIVLGGGNLCRIGWEHPDFPVRKAHLFDGVARTTPREVWALYRKFLSVRLECFQFFGASYYGTDLFHGLKALFLTYPITLALARLHAAARASESLEAQDVEYAVLAMDHCHGRSPALNFSASRMRESELANHFTALVNILGRE